LERWEFLFYFYLLTNMSNLKMFYANYATYPNTYYNVDLRIGNGIF
jgi:hypothetical protein